MPTKTELSATERVVVQFSNTPLNEDFVLTTEGDKIAAIRHIRRLRTALSRLRNYLRSHNRQPQSWKMLVKPNSFETRHGPNGPVTTCVLVRTMNSSYMRMSDSLAELMNSNLVRQEKGKKRDNG